MAGGHKPPSSGDPARRSREILAVIREVYDRWEERHGRPLSYYGERTILPKLSDIASHPVLKAYQAGLGDRLRHALCMQPKYDLDGIQAALNEYLKRLSWLEQKFGRRLTPYPWHLRGGRRKIDFTQDPREVQDALLNAGGRFLSVVRRELIEYDKGDSREIAMEIVLPAWHSRHVGIATGVDRASVNDWGRRGEFSRTSAMMDDGMVPPPPPRHIDPPYECEDIIDLCAAVSIAPDIIGSAEAAEAIEPLYTAVEAGAWYYFLGERAFYVLLRPRYENEGWRRPAPRWGAGPMMAGRVTFRDNALPRWMWNDMFERLGRSLVLQDRRVIHWNGRPFFNMGDRDLELHNSKAPVVSWEHGPRYWYWRGVRVPQCVITAPESITKEQWLAEKNAEVRRIMVHRMGGERFVEITGAQPSKKDDYGQLFRISGENLGEIVFVKVKNSTPEPDGTIKDYFLRVPPHMRTPREAVAWTFRQGGRDYKPVKET